MVTHLHLPEYVAYLRQHKPQTLPRTIADYDATLKAIAIDNVDLSPEGLSQLYVKLLGLLDTKGYVNVQRYLAILSAWSKKNGHKYLYKDLNYSKVYDGIQNRKGIRDAYSDNQIRAMMDAARQDGDDDLLNLMLLLFYSGLRISAAYPLQYSDVKEIPGCDLVTFRATSKGVTYSAVLSGKVWRDISKRHGHNKRLIVQHDDGFYTSFDKRYREKLSRLIQREGLYDIRLTTSIFHSFRKSFSQHLINSGVEPTSFYFKALLGHMPRSTTATKYYVNPDGTKTPLDITKGLAEVYSKSDLSKLTIGLKEGS